MTLRHSTWRSVLTGIVIISLAISCFLGMYLYNLALVWIKLVEHIGSIDISGQAAFEVLVVSIYGFAGFIFFRQKLKL